MQPAQLWELTADDDWHHFQGFIVKDSGTRVSRVDNQGIDYSTPISAHRSAPIPDVIFTMLSTTNTFMLTGPGYVNGPERGPGNSRGC